MTVDDLWEAIKDSLGGKGKKPPSSAAGPGLHRLLEQLVATPAGRDRFRAGLATPEGPSRSGRFYEQLVRTFESSGVVPGIPDRERADLIQEAVEACGRRNKKDPNYWRLFWLWCRSGGGFMAQKAFAEELRRRLQEGRGQHLSAVLSTTDGWTALDLPERVELLEQVRDLTNDAAFRTQVAQVLENYRARARQPVGPAARPAQSAPAAPVPARAERPAGPPSHSPAEMSSGPDRLTPPAPAMAPETVAPDSNTPARVVAAEAQTEASPVGAVAEVNGSPSPSPAEPATGPPADGPGPRPASVGRRARSQAAATGEPKVDVTELVAVIRGMADTLDRLVRGADDLAAVRREVGDVAERVTRLEHSRDGSDHEERQRLEAELIATHGRLGAAEGRAAELQKWVAAAEARIRAAEDRADQHIHEAERERDAALRTFQASLWDALQAQLADVTDPAPGEQFGSTEEEVLMTRLRRVRDALRAAGVPPF